MIDFSQVNFNYHTLHGPIPAIKDVSFKIGEGEFIALLGENGSGKSTLCKLIAGLLMPDSGKINGNLGTNGLRPFVGLMLANPEDQLVSPVVEEEVAFGLQNLGVPYPNLIKRVQQNLELLELYPFRRRLTNLLSGGEQEKVLIAALLALEPRCLVLDEATSFLDSTQQQLVQNTIQRLHKRGGFSVIWSTPQVEDALQAEHILVLHQGAIVFQGPPDQLISQAQQVKKWGLIWPDLYRLMDKLKSSGFAIPQATPSPTDIVRSLFSGDSSKFSHIEISSQEENITEKTKCSQPTQILIEVKNLTYRTSSQQPEDKPILDQINLTINEGDFYGISGHTGSGKSTLLQHLNGLLQPTSGHVRFSGTDASHSKFLHQIGMVFQYPERQFFHSEIAEEIVFGPRRLKMEESVIKENIEEVFNWLELDYQKLQKRSPFELSGGEKRKLAIACVLVMNPKVLILDEPTAGLDKHNKIDLLNKIEQLYQERNLTIIMVSHDLSELISLVNKILILHQGRGYWNGPPRELINRPNLLTGIGFILPPLWDLVHQLQQKKDTFCPAELNVKGVYSEVKKHFG